MKKVFILCLLVLCLTGCITHKKSIPAVAHKSVSVETNNVSLANNVKTKKSDILFTLDIPKINLKKGIYGFDNKKNNVNYNIELLKESTLPGEGISHIFLAAHRGNSKVSFFEELNQLKEGDLVKIYYNNKTYEYKISYFFLTDKDGTISVNLEENTDSIGLITCVKNKKDKQIVYISYKI